MIPGCFGFALLPSLIGQENLHHPFNQSNAGWKPLAVSLLSFSRAVGGILERICMEFSVAPCVVFLWYSLLSLFFFLWFHVTE